MLREQGEEFLQTSHSPVPNIHSYKRSEPYPMPQSWGLSQVPASSMLPGALEPGCSAPILTLPRPGCMTWGMSLDPSVPQCPHLKMGITPASPGCYRIKGLQ